MAKKKIQYHRGRPCVVVGKKDPPSDLVVEYQDKEGGLCRLSQSDLTDKK